MKKVMKLSVSFLATVVLSLACGHGTAAMNRAAAVSVFSPDNSTLPMCTSTISGMTGHEPSATTASSNFIKQNASSISSAMNSSSSVAETTNESDNSGNSSNPAAQANKSEKKGSGSGTQTSNKSGGSGTADTAKGSGTSITTKGSGSSAGGTTTSGKKAGKSDGSTDITVPVIDGSDTHKAEAAYDIDALKREIIAYGESRGLTYNPNMKIESSGYESPTDILQDTMNEADFVKGEKEEINYQIKQRNYAGADFCPYFVKQSNKINDYLVYELFG